MAQRDEKDAVDTAPEPHGKPVEAETESKFVAPNGETVKLDQGKKQRADSDGRPLYDWEVEPKDQVGAAGGKG